MAEGLIVPGGEGMAEGDSVSGDVGDSALREAAPELRRLQGLERIAALGEAGAFDELLDKRNYRN
ncbi:DUF2191 domain-containing protein [Actinoplanes friuliensis]|uniref:DUF2191 domain-containing protein n=1 Tax=Actinoplanes friuliensis TaxID=196914 RepID=UPI0011DD4879|nr:DUF2191 domain-containing protein [Actinoplanes friuliensis]